MIIRTVRQRTAAHACLTIHRLVHIVWIGHAADDIRTSHFDIVVLWSASVLVAMTSDVLIKYDVAVCLVRVFLD